MVNLFIKVKRMIIEVTRQEESEKIAAFLAEKIKESWSQGEVAQGRGQQELALNQDFPWVILLDGDLGAGKTTFTQALAKEMALEEPVTSPTFNLVNEYKLEVAAGASLEAVGAKGSGAADAQSLETGGPSLGQEPGAPRLSRNFFHFDLYRLDHEEELFDIGFEEYFAGPDLLVIEWADKFIEEIPKPYLGIRIRVTGPQAREFEFTAADNEVSGWTELLEELKEYADSGF